MARHPVFAFDNDRRPVGDLAEVIVREGFHDQVIVPVLVEARRVWSLGVEHIDDRRQFLVLNHGGLRQILGFGPRIGNTDGYRLAHEPDLANRQCRIIGALVPGHLGRCAHRLHAGHVRRGKN